MAITYVFRNSLYVYLTAHCTNKCVFCPREASRGDAYAEPAADNDPPTQMILAELSSFDLDNFSEIVFGGGGEPTCRLFDMLEICKKLRETTSTPIRVNTNGHASMIMREDTVPMFKGLVDSISINMNAADADTYMKLCHPKFGEDAFIGVIKFAREIVKYVPNVTMSVYRDTLSDTDEERCRIIAAEIGAKFTVRDMAD